MAKFTRLRFTGLKEVAIDRFQDWLDQGKLIGVDGERLTELLEVRSQQLADKNPSIVLLAEADPAAFLAGFIAAVAADCSLVLGNPGWAIEEWQQVFGLVCPDRVWTDSAIAQGIFSESINSFGAKQTSASILIPTGGSSGKIRFVVHTWQTLTASVVGFQQYFEVSSIDSCCVLPLYHVSGLMQLMRSFLTNGTLAIFPSKTLEAEQSNFDPSGFFLSIVPTQLQRLLQTPETAAWLSRFQTVLLGGAPAWDTLLIQARQYQIQLAPTYGMTETASQVVTMKPVDFLQGKIGCGQVLPHAKVKILDSMGAELPIGEVGTIAIQAKSLMLDYFPPVEPVRSQLLTDDLGYFDAQGFLQVVGRSSQKIITGGENVFPAEVEAAIRSTGLVKDVCVVGVSDRHWGEVVVAVIVVAIESGAIAGLEAVLENRLANYKHPKRWLLLPELPRNAQGKINALLLQQRVMQECEL